jgi:hypothetical protein
MGFTSSSRNQNRNSDSQDKTDKQNSATFGDDLASTDRASAFRDKFSRDRDSERPPRERNNLLGTRRNGRDEDGNGWATVNRTRRGSQQEEGDRWQRPDRNKDTEPVEDSSRRNGAGRGRFDRPWGREEQQGEIETPRAGAASSWRERNRDKERERGEWTRGGRVQDRVEEDPEWMDEPIEEKKKKKQTEHTQEDFQRWLESSRKKNTNAGPEEKADSMQSAQDAKDAANQSKAAALTLNLAGGMFNSFGMHKKVEEKPSEEVPAAPIPAPKSTPAAAKASRFNKYFQKEETPPMESEAPAPPAAGSNGVKAEEDAIGFDRILQMLNATKVGGQAPRADAQPRSARLPTQMGFPATQNEQENVPPPSSRPDSAGLINDLLARHALNASRARGPQTAPVETEGATQYFPNPNGEFGRMPNGRGENAAQRAGNGVFSPPFPGQNPLPNPGQNAGQGGDRNRDFLLNLIQNSRGNSDGPSEESDYAQFHLGPNQRKQGLQQETPQRMTPSAPPGLYDGPFPRREEEPQMEPLRKTTSRSQQQQQPPQQLPPGFFAYPDQDPMGALQGMPGLQRRNTNDLQQQQRQQPPPMSNMGIPSQQAPADPFRMNHMPQGMPMPPNGQDPRPGHMAPPPGFDNRPRPPPGFQQQGPLPPMPQMNNPPLGHPGLGRDPRIHGAGAMFGQMPPPGNMNLPPTGHLGGPPPGYFSGMPPPQPGMPHQGMPNGPPQMSRADFMMMQAQAQAQAQGRGGQFPNDDMGRGRGMPGPPPPGFHM